MDHGSEVGLAHSSRDLPFQFMCFPMRLHKPFPATLVCLLSALYP